MSNLQVDLTGLTPEQISQQDEEKTLQQLHQEFDWLVADIGIKNSLHRSDIYDKYSLMESIGTTELTNS